MTGNNLQTSRYARDDDEAKERFEQYKSEDPFPSIAPALLNSADIADYVAATGMIFPFEENDRRLKSASYRIDLLGDYIYWDEKGEEKGAYLSKGEILELKPNSIVFVTVEPMFRIPDYIALRFNLQITHVYKGLLVGTGPLVDPGFTGKLSLPIHNLTANKYELKGGEALIWMEFTKLSENPKWKTEQDAHNKMSPFYGFPLRKNELSGVKDYIFKGVGLNKSVVSSIPSTVEEALEEAKAAADSSLQAKKDADESKKKVDEIDKKITKDLHKVSTDFNVLKIEVSNANEVAKAQTDAKIEGVAKRVSLWSATVTLFVIFGSFFGLLLPSYNLVKTTTVDLKATETSIKEKGGKIKELEATVIALTTKVTELENTLKSANLGSSTSPKITRP